MACLRELSSRLGAVACLGVLGVSVVPADTGLLLVRSQKPFTYMYMYMYLMCVFMS